MSQLVPHMHSYHITPKDTLDVNMHLYGHTVGWVLIGNCKIFFSSQKFESKNCIAQLTGVALMQSVHTQMVAAV